jgi:hypothetical protein
MKIQAFFATALLAAAASTSVQAQVVPDPCTLFQCMAGMPGVVGNNGGPSCTTPLMYWHAVAPLGLAVYHPPQGFNPPASAALRRTFLSTCPGVSDSSNAAILELIITEYGYLP